LYSISGFQDQSCCFYCGIPVETPVDGRPPVRSGRTVLPLRCHTSYGLLLASSLPPHRAGDLVTGHIPDMEDELIRVVGRGRTNAVKEAKQQLKSFLPRNEYRYTGTATRSGCRSLRPLLSQAQASLPLVG